MKTVKFKFKIGKKKARLQMPAETANHLAAFLNSRLRNVRSTITTEVNDVAAISEALHDALDAHVAKAKKKMEKKIEKQARKMEKAA